MDANPKFGRNILRIVAVNVALALFSCDVDHEQVSDISGSAGTTRSPLDSSEMDASVVGGRASLSRTAVTRDSAAQGTSEQASDYGSANAANSAKNRTQGGATAAPNTSFSSTNNGTREKTGDTTGKNQSGGVSGAAQMSQTRLSSTASGEVSSSSQSTRNTVGGAKTTGVTNAAVLCVFDYDLTLTTHDCAENEDVLDGYCRVADDCGVYGWSDSEW